MNSNERLSIENYDKIAENYDKTIDGKFTLKFKKKTLEIIKLKNNDNVLDVGCGNGSLIANIDKKFNVNSFGIDISPKMIDICKKKYTGIDFRVSNGESLPFEDDFFDCITICCVLHHLNDANKFFSEAKRIIKPGGTLIVAEPWLPIGVSQLADYVISPLLKAGDNKVFSHKKLKNLFTANKFTLENIYKKGIMQIVTGKKNV
jgi:ubiquinone/menaquinone biosynthesis C-methylase UbiE